MAEFFTQAGVHGNIFRVFSAESQVIADASVLFTPAVDTETLSKYYTNYRYKTGIPPEDEDVVPIYGSLLSWSITVKTTFTGTPVQRAKLIVQVQSSNPDTPTTADAGNYDLSYEIPLITYSGLGDFPVCQGEYRIHAKYARLIVSNETGQSQSINIHVWGKIL